MISYFCPHYSTLKIGKGLRLSNNYFFLMIRVGLKYFLAQYENKFKCPVHAYI